MAVRGYLADWVTTPDGDGVIIRTNFLTGQVKVALENGQVKSYNVKELK
jgi:hypothetical protein